MGRTKRGRKLKKDTKDEEEYTSDEGLNPESDDFFQDEVDKFHINREKIMLEENQESDEEDSDDDNEDIMGLDLEESEDDDNNDDDDNDSEDSEEGESDEESKLPSDKSWGKKKSTFYDADTADADIGSDEEAWEVEKQEEEAALVLQQRMAAALDEEDFDVANFQISVDEEKDDNEEKKTVVMDLSKLSKEQKLEILFRDSPELFELLEEFKTKLEEVTSVLSPLIQIAKLGKVLPEGAKYLELKHQLYLNYCINIGFYLLLKARQTPVKGHPVIERIVQYRTLIKELEPQDKELELDIEMLLANKEELLQQSDNIEASQTGKLGKDSKTKKNLKKKKYPKTKILDLLDDSEDEDFQEQENEPPKKKTKKKKDHEGYSDPLEYYEKIRLEKKQTKDMKKAATSLAREPGFEEDDLDENEDVKRAITYQISKNKGLTAKKKKQDRNPRVKHRKKYTKAVIKRKSQVRPVVTERNRYEGEKSGIRAFLTRSVKIK